MGNENVVQRPSPQFMTLPLISIVLPSPSIESTSQIKGQIVIQPREQIIITNLQVSLRVERGWVLFSGKNRTETLDLFTNRINLSSLDPYNRLYVTLFPGQYVFDFLIQIPPNTLPSFFYLFEKGGHAFNRYTLIATALNSFSNTKWTEEKVVEIIMPKVPIDKPFVIQNKTSVYSMNILPVGSNILKVELTKEVYSYNEPIVISGFIDNRKSSANVLGLRANVFRRIILFNSNKKEVYTETKKVGELVKDDIVVSGGQKKDFIYGIQIMNEFKNTHSNFYKKLEKSPYAKIIDSLHCLIPTIFSEFFTCEYRLYVYLCYGALVANDKESRIICPFTLSSNGPISIQNFLNPAQVPVNPMERSMGLPDLPSIENSMQLNRSHTVNQNLSYIPSVNPQYVNQVLKRNYNVSKIYGYAPQENNNQKYPSYPNANLPSSYPYQNQQPYFDGNNNFQGGPVDLPPPAPNFECP